MFVISPAGILDDYGNAADSCSVLALAGGLLAKNYQQTELQPLKP